MSHDLNSGIHSHIAGLEKKTGQPISYWVDMVRSWDEPRHMANVQRLKEEFGIGHGHANMVVHLTKENTSLHMDENQVEDSVFKGKEHWKSLHERIVTGLQATGLDFELNGKKKYYSIRTNKQVGSLVPATKGRFEVWINVKGQEPTGNLQLMKAGSMCSHAIHLTEEDADISEVLLWLERAIQRTL
jgi:hypothetical protein